MSQPKPITEDSFKTFVRENYRAVTAVLYLYKLDSRFVFYNKIDTRPLYFRVRFKYERFKTAVLAMNLFIRSRPNERHVVEQLLNREPTALKTIAKETVKKALEMWPEWAPRKETMENLLRM